MATRAASRELAGRAKAPTLVPAAVTSGGVGPVVVGGDLDGMGVEERKLRIEDGAGDAELREAG